MKLPLTRLKVFVPEVHDLAIMKIVRGWDKDLETLKALHQQTPLDLEILLERYRDETDHILGMPAAFDANFEVALEDLFGRQGTRAFKRIDRRRASKGS